MNTKVLFLIIFVFSLLLLAGCNTASDVQPSAEPSVVTQEEAVVNALVEYLEGQGAPVSQMNFQVKKIADDYAWAEVISTDPAAPGGFNAFMKLENGVWTTVASGSGMEMEHVEALGIPQSVWPEGWLLQVSQQEAQAQPTSTRSATGCLEGTVEEQTQSLVDDARGFCLLYPASHSVEQLDSGNTEIVLGSVLNHTDPRASIEVEDLAGRNLDQVVEEFLAEYEGFDIERSTINVGGEAAIQLDRIPGQDFYRKVMVAHDAYLYQISFLPYDPGLVDTFAQAEQIYRIIIDSFRFVNSGQAPTESSTSNSGLAICPDLPRPAMVFRAENGEELIFRDVAGDSECTMEFDPPISRLLLLAADGIYYSTSDGGEGSTNQRIIHYANDGTFTELSFLNADNTGSIVISPSGARIAWSQRRTAKTTEDEEMLVSELYSSKMDGSDRQLLNSVDNAEEVERGEPYLAWIIRPLRFLDENDLLYTIEPDGRGGSWNAYTGRYSNLQQTSISTGENNLVYECPVSDYSSFCVGAISADNAYFVVTTRETGEITLFRMDGTPAGTFSGPGQDYTGYPTFSPTGDLVFMTADVAEDQITIEQAFMSLVRKPYDAAGTTLLTEPLSYIWNWVDEQHILYTAVTDGQTGSFSLSLVNLDGQVERLPTTYGLFQGVQP